MTPRSSGTTVLELRGITKRFGDFVANDRVDLDVRAGRGARAARRERRGQVDADELPLRPVPARRGRDRGRAAGTPRFTSTRRRDRAGIGMVHQHFMLIPVMTVAENIVLGGRAAARRRSSTWREAERRVARAVRRATAWRSTRRRAVEDIGVGMQQRVEILKALYRDARLLDPRRADRGADAAGGARAVRRAARARGARHGDHPDHPQARRGARDRRPRSR